MIWQLVISIIVFVTFWKRRRFSCNRTVVEQNEMHGEEDYCQYDQVDYDSKIVCTCITIKFLINDVLHMNLFHLSMTPIIILHYSKL